MDFRLPYAHWVLKDKKVVETYDPGDVGADYRAKKAGEHIVRQTYFRPPWAGPFTHASFIIKISTAFMSTNTAAYGGKPEFFETIIFYYPEKFEDWETSNELDGRRKGYATWIGAEYGHYQAVKMVFSTFDEISWPALPAQRR